MVEVLYKAGFKVVILRVGLLCIVEVCYILACLKYLINFYDDLLVVEILMFYGSYDLEVIVESWFSYVVAWEVCEKEF